MKKTRSRKSSDTVPLMRCRIDLPSEIPAGECELAADFAGKIRSGLQGVYLNRQAGKVADLES